ncbi:hypothetical protein DFH09DRAFT_1166977 [Mycena vulgaris]|nr:hypothetical protein DFH09DRAFT_1166977 [Mycena vulgaris]
MCGVRRGFLFILTQYRPSFCQGSPWLTKDAKLWKHDEGGSTIKRGSVRWYHTYTGGHQAQPMNAVLNLIKVAQT